MTRYAVKLQDVDGGIAITIVHNQEVWQ